MSIKESLTIEMQRETDNTKRLLERLNQDHWTWKPHEKSMSAGALAKHIVELQSWLPNALEGDSFNYATDYQPNPSATFEELIQILEAGLAKNIEFANSKSDEFWFDEWTFKYGEHVIGVMPKIGAYRFVITNHLIHHRGQLSVYLRLLDIPVPGIYGPSADETM
ncbi:DinB family protein [Soonwooa purpurea]